MVHSQRKGRRVEHEIRDTFAAAGIQVREHGIYEPDDLTAVWGGEERTVEVKARAAGFRQIYGYLGSNDALVIKADRKPALIVLRLDEAVKLMGAGDA